MEWQPSFTQPGLHGNTETVKKLLSAGADVILQEKVKQQVLLQTIVVSCKILQ